MLNIRILIAAQRTEIRDAINRKVENEMGVEIVAICDSARGLAQAYKRSKPDLLILDLELEDILQTWNQLMLEEARPSVAIADKVSPDLVQAFIDSGGLAELKFPVPDDLVSQIRLYSGVRVVARRGSKKRDLRELGKRKRSQVEQPHRTRTQLPVGTGKYSVLCIGASTGGPQVLLGLLKAWKSGLSVPIVVVQHIVSGGFVESLVEWLAKDSGAQVRIADNHEPLEPGVTYFAPDGFHLKLVVKEGFLVTELSSAPPRSAFRPSIDVLFESAARCLGRRAIGVLLTGMGRDGAQGLLQVKKSGGLTIIQDEQSCVIYGMPQEALKIGAASFDLPPEEIAKSILRLVSS